MKNSEMIIFQNPKTRMYWDGKDFNADIREKALAYPANQEKPMVASFAAKGVKSVDVHGYVSSANLAADAQKGLELTHSKRLHKLGKEVITTLAAAGEKYLKLCTYIRENEVTKKLVAFELGALGFSRATISKINTVSNLPPEQWNKYAARELGFNKVLALGSGSVQEAIAEESGDSVIDVKAEVERLDDADERAESENPELVERTESEVKADWERKLSNAAAMVLRAAAAMTLRQKTIDGGNGYKLVVQLLPKKKGKGRSNEISKGKDPKK